MGVMRPVDRRPWNTTAALEGDMRTPIIPAIAALAFAASSAATDLPYRGEGHIFVDPSDIEWSSVASMAEPAQIAVLEGALDEAEPFTIRLKLPAGYEVLPHVHPEYERVTVLEGTFHFAHGETFDREQTTALPPGGFAVMAPGEPMFGYTEVDTVIQLHGTGPWGIDYLDPEDDPRS
jgi:hypothetical protein